jgi:hypothetical protein
MEQVPSCGCLFGEHAPSVKPGGRREELAKRLQARYGFARAEAEREIDA